MAMGQMMVENIPFMHVICRIAIQNQGEIYYFYQFLYNFFVYCVFNKNRLSIYLLYVIK